MKFQRSIPITALTLLLMALFTMALEAGFLQAAPLTVRSGSGEALALRSELHALVPMAAKPSTFRLAGIPTDTRRGSDGRYIYDKSTLLRSGVIRKAHTTTVSTSQVNEAVQTFDVFNPPPGFTPTQGTSLTPTNLTPIWSADETMLVFSSNRTTSGGVGTRFHLWAIPINGGTPIQLTDSAGASGGGEFYPALSAGNNQQIAFTSDANSAGVQNLYTMPFTASTVEVSSLTSPTIRTDAGAVNAGGTGFSQVQRPTFSSSNSDEIIFSALSTAGSYTGHYHLYFLYASTSGYNPSGGTDSSLPAKITDGPADDTDPAYSEDGQLIAFASTATGMSATGSAPTNSPNSSLVLTNAPSGSNRNLFLIGGGSRIGFGAVTNSGGSITTVGQDNFGPAWSSIRVNTYINPAPGVEYLAFARGASTTSPHDIYYLKVLQNIDASGESSKSNEAGTTPLRANTPVYQINAGGPEIIGTNAFAGQDFASVAVLSAQANRPVILSGGTAETQSPTPIVNLLNDPTTPPAVYNTDETGTFTYTFRQLTPQADYKVRLHLSDPKDKVPGARVFSVTINGVAQTVTDANGNPTTSIDIVQQAQSAPGRLIGLVSDSVTGAAIAGATISVTDFTTGDPIVTTPSPVLTSGTTSVPPSGTALINYTATIPSGSVVVTLTPPANSGYGTVSQVVNINGGVYSRADFSLTQGTGTISGVVTDSNLSPVVGATVTFTNPTTGVAAVTTPAVITTDNSGSYTATLPVGRYNVTVTPAPSSGIATRTQLATLVAANTPAVPLVLNFSVATGSGAGNVAGLVTDSVSGLPIPGATIKVLSGTSIIAILTASSTTTNTAAAPVGDGNPANYSALLPVGTYSFQFSASGYATVSQTVTVVNTPTNGTIVANAFVRADEALVNGTVTAGQNTAVLEDFTTTVPAQNILNTNGQVITNAGSITVSFAPISGDPPIVQAIEVISDSAAVTSSGFGGLASSLSTSAPTLNSAIGGVSNSTPQITLNFSTGLTNFSTPDSYNIYRTPGTGVFDNTPPPDSPLGTEGLTPIATIPATSALGGTYTDTSVALNDEYFYYITAVYTEQVVPETAASGLNPAVLLNTDDNAGQTSVAGNLYDDIYPTWSPFKSIFSIAYSSNRTVTYNDPANNSASVEKAISVGRGGILSAAGTVGTNYAGILESQLLNLDPPTLLPYSGNEVIHISDAAGNTTRTGITPGQPVTFTVRLSDREAGIDDTGGPGGKPNVYIQIKDPDSKYQDAQGLEHKVFAKDSLYRYQTNNTLGTALDSGTSALLMNGGSPISYGGFGGTIGDNLNSDASFGINDTYSGYNGFTINGIYTQFPQRGAVGGIDGPEGFSAAPIGPSANKSDTISIGRSGDGTNPGVPVDANGNPILDANKNPVFLPGSDPDRFIPWGPEYECQVVNPQFSNGTGDTIATDYVSPYYLAGVDDQQPFSGTGRLRPIVSSAGAPAEWLQLTRAATQDGQGGVLYTATWKTPTSASDYYLDVIAFDKAVPPATYTIGGQSNWRIYDNVWGFSTASTITSNDILVVSDYALGQKFAATTFGGQQGLLNLIPKLYGTESYVTDIDISLLPNAVYRTALYPGADPKNSSNYLPETLLLDQAYNADGSTGTTFSYNVLNSLGVGSYDDQFIDDGGSVDGVPYVKAQRYSLWRILSRGPVPDAIFQSYEPTLISQPAVIDPGASTAGINIKAGTVASANRCIVWLSPYTGDLLTGPGTLTDPATQASLTSFVAAGGRLCVSGQDVASALTQSGTTNSVGTNFLSTVLGATLNTSSGGTHLPVGGNNVTKNRITNSPFYDGQVEGVNSLQEVNADFTITTHAIYERPLLISNNYGGNIFQGDNGLSVFPETPSYSGNWRTDGALDQLGPYIQPFPVSSTNSNSNTVVGKIDTITPNTAANVFTDITLQAFTNPIPPVSNGNDAAASGPGGVGLIYTDNTITTAATGTTGTTTTTTSLAGSGSKVVFASFGLEGLSTEYYKQTGTATGTPVVYLPRNQRQNIIHNIVDYLRTGSITGNVISTSGGGVIGSGIPGVTVYLQSAFGATIPGRGTFSATTDAAGNFRIDGIEPGDYTLAAYRTGYTRTTSNPGTVFTVEGDSTQSASLTLTQTTPGSITGTVTDGTNPVPGATVVFKSADGQNEQVTTDANGKYTLSSVPQDTYSGTASKLPGYGTSAAQTVTVTGNAILTVNFILKPGPGAASGRVTDLSGTPISGATVIFTSGSPATVVKTATTASDGTYNVTGIAAGSYSVSASATGYGVSAPITAAITAGGTLTLPDIQLGPVVNGTLGGIVTAATDSTPLSGVTLTIVNTATGATVTTTTTTTSAAPDGSGSINFGPLTLATGTYTITATKNGVSSTAQTVTISGGAFSRADFTGITGLASLHTFSPGLNFLSLPYDYSTSSFDTIFGALNTAATGTTPNGNRSHVAVWNPLTSAYAVDPNAPADALRLGVGYWIYLKSAVSLNSAGGTPSGSTVAVALHPFWNQIGVPSTTAVPVSSLQFDMGGGAALLSFASATSSTLHVISPTLYRFDGQAYQSLAAGDSLQPYQAYWIESFVETTVKIPTGQ